MVISPLPYWVGAIVCAIVLAVNALAVIKASAAAQEVERIDRKVKAQTFFIKSLTVDAETLLSRAKSEEAKVQCKKVYEAIRYSDPMSSELLAAEERQIAERFAALSMAVAEDDTRTAFAVTEEILLLLKDRNNKCRMLK